MALRAKCRECGFVAAIPENKASAKNYCPQCNARLPRPVHRSPAGLIVIVIGAAIALFCLVPAGVALALWGLRDRPANPPPAQAEAVAAQKPAVPAPEAAPTKPVVPPTSPTSVKPDPPKDGPLDGSLPPDLLERLKAATVFVKATTARGTSMGSGFVFKTDGDDAFVVTNHHVVEDRLKGPGRNVVPTCRVVFHSGRRPEFTATATVLSSDDNRDLAVLRVSGIRGMSDFPDALGSGASADLRETMPVYILGFPFGEMLATNAQNPVLTIGKGTVSSLRLDESGDTTLVQIDGDINPGNSGGPVVDRQGRLVGISVAKIRNTNIGLAIPAEHLARMLLGRIANLAVRDTLTAQAGRVEVQIDLKFIDPFAKIRSASVIVAPVDDAGAAPVRGRDGWPAIPGTRHRMQIGDQSATVTIPLSGSGTKRYLIQPIYSNGESDEVRAQPAERVISFLPRSKSPAVSSTTRPSPGVLATTIPPPGVSSINRPPPGISSTTRPPGVSSVTPIPPVPPARPAEIAKAFENPKPSGKAQPVGEIRTKDVQFAAKKERVRGRRRSTPPCLCWSADAQSFFTLDNGADVVRRYSFPDLKEEARLDVGKECSWLSPCKDGLLVTVTGEQEAWVLDAKTLQKKSSFSVFKAIQVVSTFDSPYAYSVTEDQLRGALSVHDLRTNKTVAQQPIEGVSNQFGALVISPDGKRLFTVTGWRALCAFDVNGEKVRPAEKSGPILSTRFAGICLSHDGQYICTPTVAGNELPDGFPRACSTLVFKASDLTKPILQLKTGFSPQAVGFDMKSGLIYAQSRDDQLIVVDDGGIKLKAFPLNRSKGVRPEIIQFLVHPDGRKLVALADDSGVTGAKAIAVELPVPK